jgi:hypothetical protein
MTGENNVQYWDKALIVHNLSAYNNRRTIHVPPEVIQMKRIFLQNYIKIIHYYVMGQHVRS